PTLHLDVCHQFEALDLVRQLSQDEQLTVVIVSHDLPMVVKYCDRIVLIHDHKVFALGTPEEVLTPENMRIVFNIEAVLEYDTTLKANSVKIIGSMAMRKRA
ncbi:MAG: ABC transporter ATP-binding protein, partial [Methanomassiliicoccales archaeon]